MAAACCGDRCGFKNLLADGAFLMLSAFCGFGSCRVNDPLAGAVSRFVLFVVATRTFMPVVSIIRLPFCACGMSGSRNLHTGFIGNFYRSCCICEPLVTAIAGVVCGIARSSAGGSFRSNQSQIVSVFFVFIFVIICNNRSVRNNRLIQAVNLYKFIIIKCFCRC